MSGTTTQEKRVEGRRNQSHGTSWSQNGIRGRGEY